MVCEERGTQGVGVALTQLLVQACRAFDIGEEQGDGSGREFTHAAPPFADT